MVVASRVSFHAWSGHCESRAKLIQTASHAIM